MVIKNGKKVSSIPVKSIPGAIAISVDGKEVAIGCQDFKVNLYSLTETTLTPLSITLESNRGEITAMAYSPDGKYLAVADSDRKILVYATTPTAHPLVFSEWVFHTARVNCVAWSKDSLHAVSGGLDRDVYVWSVQQPMKSICIRGAHQDGVSGVGFLDNQTVISCGNDACVKTWTITHHK